MKILFSILLTTLTLSTASAGIGGVVGGSNDGRINPSQDWGKIRDAVRGTKKYKISGDYAFVGQIVSLFDVCTDGQNFITTREYPYYETRYVGKSRDNNDTEKDGWASVVAGYRKLVYPLETKKWDTICNNHGKKCRRIQKDFIQETSKEIKVEKLIRYDGSERDKPVYKSLFKKDYHVPYCDK